MTTLHHDGYATARESVSRMGRDQLLKYIDGLWGRDNLRFEATDEDIREEALAQCEREFRCAR
jgi:hypothetical protein